MGLRVGLVGLGVGFFVGFDVCVGLAVGKCKCKVGGVLGIPCV